MFDSAARYFYYRLFRLSLRLRCTGSDFWEALAGPRTPPLPPALLRYKVSERIGRKDFLAVGAKTAEAIEEALNGAGHSLERLENVLDFGCGCGRTIRWLIERFPRTAFWGTDVDTAAVAWCQRHLRANFAANAAAPPLPFPAANFDCIYAISVFTHLGEEHQQAWLAEFQRVLRPGGILLLSLHGAGAQGGLDPRDVETLRTRGFLFKRSSKLQGIHPAWYQTSFHTEEYVARNFSGAFQVLAYNRLGLGYQDIVILQRA